MREPRIVLSVHPDASVQKRIRESLGAASMEVVEAGTARDALEAAGERRPDLVLVDMVLPDASGLGFCRMLREHPDLAGVPIIMVTSYSSEVDRIVAFESGVDDFVPEPFYGRELASRVRAILRRHGACRSADPGPAPRHGVLTLEPSLRQVRVDDRPVSLTPKEYEILAALVQQEGRVLSREQILKRIGGDAERLSERVIDAHVKSLRRKLAGARDYLETVRGVGYRFAVPPS